MLHICIMCSEGGRGGGGRNSRTISRAGPPTTRPAGASADTLASIEAPAVVVFDHVDDGMHTPAASRALASALGNCQEVIIGEGQEAWLQRVAAFVSAEAQAQAEAETEAEARA